MVEPPRFLTVKLIADLAAALAPWMLVLMLPFQTLTSFLVGLCRKPISTFIDSALPYIFVLTVSIHQSVELARHDLSASHLARDGVFFSIPVLVYVAGYSIRMVLRRVIRIDVPPGDRKEG